MQVANIKQIAFLGDRLPRQCGIATFTSDICDAMATEFPECQCVVGAVNDRPEGYDYPARIRFEIDEKELDSYRRAADFLNVNNAEVIPSGDTVKATTKVSIWCRRLLRLPTLKSRAILPSRQACFASFKLPLTARNRPFCRIFSRFFVMVCGMFLVLHRFSMMVYGLFGHRFEGLDLETQ